MSSSLRRTGWGIVSLLVVLMALAAGTALVIEPADAPEFLGNLYERRVALWTHIVGSTVALVAGPVQFYLRRLTPMTRRARYLPLHRWLGWVYIAGALIGAGIAGLFLAFQTHTGFAAGLGFGTLAVLVLITTFLAWLRIRDRNEPAHREWMTRSFALLFAAPTLRIWLVLFTIGFGVDERDAYIAVAWFCWVPNLIVAEVLIHRVWHRPAIERQPAAATGVTD
jgi:hypothetical protein